MEHLKNKLIKYTNIQKIKEKLMFEIFYPYEYVESVFSIDYKKLII